MREEKDREREKMKELVKGEIWEYREIVQRVGLFFGWVWGFVNLWRDVTLTKITFILVIICLIINIILKW